MADPFESRDELRGGKGERDVPYGDNPPDNLDDVMRDDVAWIEARVARG